MTSREQIDLRMGSKDPEAIVFPLERLYRCTLVEVPNANCFVFADREDEVLMRMEEAGRCVLKVTSTGIYLPSFGFYNVLAVI